MVIWDAGMGEGIPNSKSNQFGFLWIPMNIHGYPWIARMSMDIHGYPLIFMGTHEYLWISMQIHVYQRISMDIHKKPSIPMDPLISMDP